MNGFGYLGQVLWILSISVFSAEEGIKLWVSNMIQVWDSSDTCLKSDYFDSVNQAFLTVSKPTNPTVLAWSKGNLNFTSPSGLRIMDPQRSCEEEYKPWRWGATAKYYTSHTNWDHVTNEEVHAKIQQAVRPHEDLTIKKKCKLKWYGHATHSSSLAKTILQCTVKGGWRQGRKKKMLEDSTGEWAGLEFCPRPRGQWRTEKNGPNWLWSHLWCPNNLCG